MARSGTSILSFLFKRQNLSTSTIKNNFGPVQLLKVISPSHFSVDNFIDCSLFVSRASDYVLIIHRDVTAKH